MKWVICKQDSVHTWLHLERNKLTDMYEISWVESIFQATTFTETGAAQTAHKLKEKGYDVATEMQTVAAQREQRMRNEILDRSNICSNPS